MCIRVLGREACSPPPNLHKSRGLLLGVRVGYEPRTPCLEWSPDAEREDSYFPAGAGFITPVHASNMVIALHESGTVSRR